MYGEGRKCLFDSHNWEPWVVGGANSSVFNGGKKGGITWDCNGMLVVCDDDIDPLEGCRLKTNAYLALQRTFAWHVGGLNNHPRRQKSEAVRLFLPQDLFSNHERILQVRVSGLFCRVGGVPKNESVKNQQESNGTNRWRLHRKDVWVRILELVPRRSKNELDQKHDGLRVCP